MSGVRIGALLVATLAACAPARAPEPLPPDPASDDFESDDDPTAREPIDILRVAKRVARLRGAKAPASLDLHVLDDDGFARRAKNGATSWLLGKKAPSYWVAFGFAPPSLDLDELAAARAARGVEGFFDSRELSVYVRAERSSSDRRQRRLILVHEVEHALQHATFADLFDFGASADDDQRIARLAMIEGDATLSAVAYGASTAEGIALHWGERAARLLAAAIDDPKQEARSEALAALPPLARARAVFPYREGLAFALALFRAGGFALVDEAMRHPPVSTEQVLHPAKYLEGDAPIAVPPPSTPDGYRAVANGTLGELHTRVLLAQCMPDREARRAAEGWGGDAFAIVADDAGRTATLWSTVWDDDGAAERFEAAIRRRVGCAALGDATLDVARSGRRVAVWQGTRGARARIEAIPEPEPKRVSRPRAIVPPIVLAEDAFLHRGRLSRRAYDSAPLGLRVPIPSAFTATTTTDGPEVRVARDDHGAVGQVAVVLRPPSEHVEHVISKYVLLDERGDGGRAPSYVGVAPIRVGELRVMAHGWESRSGVRQRVAFAPACDGRATVVVSLSGSDYMAWDALKGWAESIVLPRDDSPACAWLGRSFD